MYELDGLTVDERIDRLLEQRYPGALDALGKSFLSKIGSKLKKVVKKVAPIALGAGALFLGGGLLKTAATAITGKVSKSKPAGAPPGVITSALQTVASVAVPVAQAAAADAISAGVLPPTPGAAASQEALMAAAVQVARNELLKQGYNMSSPEAQGVLRQAVHEAGAGAAAGATAAAAGFDWKKAAPWIAGGAAVLVGATVLLSDRRAR